MKNVSKKISASQMLRNKTIRSAIDNNMILPTPKEHLKILIEPNRLSKISFSEVGTAYDFWLRCHVIRSRMLQAPNKQKRFFVYHVQELRGVKWYEKYYGKVTLTRGLANKHLNHLSSYIENPPDKLTEFLKACLFFGKFETEYRSGILVDNPEVSEANLNELERLAIVTKLDWLHGKNPVGNPTFNRHGKKFKVSADGDFLVDHCLYELKTTSQFSFKPVLRQLVLYYILNKLGSNGYRINFLGLYYPRFNYRDVFPIRDVLTKENEKHLVAYFKDILGK